MIWVLSESGKETGKMKTRDATAGVRERTFWLPNFGAKGPTGARKCEEIYFHSGWTPSGLWEVNSFFQLGSEIVLVLENFIKFFATRACPTHKLGLAGVKALFNRWSHLDLATADRIAVIYHAAYTGPVTLSGTPFSVSYSTWALLLC